VFCLRSGAPDQASAHGWHGNPRAGSAGFLRFEQRSTFFRRSESSNLCKRCFSSCAALAPGPSVDCALDTGQYSLCIHAVARRRGERFPVRDARHMHSKCVAEKCRKRWPAVSGPGRTGQDLRPLQQYQRLPGSAVPSFSLAVLANWGVCMLLSQNERGEMQHQIERGESALVHASTVGPQKKSQARNRGAKGRPEVRVTSDHPRMVIKARSKCVMLFPPRSRPGHAHVGSERVILGGFFS
jgi:hypothetical protein